MGMFNKKEKEQQHAYQRLENLYRYLFEENEQNKLAIIRREQQIKKLNDDIYDQYKSIIEIRQASAAEIDKLKKSTADVDKQKQQFNATVQELNATIQKLKSDRAENLDRLSRYARVIKRLSTEEDQRKVALENVSASNRRISVKNERLTKQNKQLKEQIALQRARTAEHAS